MRKTDNLLYKFKYCLSFLSANLFCQTPLYQSTFPLEKSSSEFAKSSLLLTGNKIIYNAPNYTLYAIDVKNFKNIWEQEIGWRSINSPYVYKNTFFYSSYDGKSTRLTQFDINSGRPLQILELQSLHSVPHFINSMMYITALEDGGKLIAYDLSQNKIIWHKNIGHGVDVQPIYLNDKIIASAGENQWFEIDYQGNILASKSKQYTHLEEEKISVKNYTFLSHDQKEITTDFLKKYKLQNTEYQLEKNLTQTFILSENQLIVLGNNRKVKLQLNLETIISSEEYEPDALSKIIQVDSEKVWFVHQNHLIHYDFKRKKLLRNVYLDKWRPHQLVLDGRIIWLISKNDAQIYALDFEPDEKTNYNLNREKAIQDHFKCDPPNEEKIKAAKATLEN